MRVCEIAGSDADAHERAAMALAKAGGDASDIVRLARRASSLDPKNAVRRVALASVYIAAGLTENARHEIETALSFSLGWYDTRDDEAARSVRMTRSGRRVRSSPA